MRTDIPAWVKNPKPRIALTLIGAAGILACQTSSPSPTAEFRTPTQTESYASIYLPPPIDALLLDPNSYDALEEWRLSKVAEGRRVVIKHWEQESLRVWPHGSSRVRTNPFTISEGNVGGLLVPRIPFDTDVSIHVDEDWDIWGRVFTLDGRIPGLISIVDGGKPQAEYRIPTKPPKVYLWDNPRHITRLS